MRRTRVIFVALFFAVIGAIVPLLVALRLSWVQAFRDEQQLLLEYSNRMLTRSIDTLTVARRILFQLQHKTFNPICSPKHIEYMNEITLKQLEVVMIAYIEQGIEQCNSFGVMPIAPVTRKKANFIFVDGLEVMEASQQFNANMSLAVLSNGQNYDIYIRPERFTDIIVPQDTQLAIVYIDKIVSRQNNFNMTLFNKILSSDYFKGFSRGSKKNISRRSSDKLNISQNKVFTLDGNLVSVSQFGLFSFIATEPMRLVYQQYKKKQRVLLPFGLITGLCIVGIVIYYSRKRLSMEFEILTALKQHEFFLHYQPILHMNSARCIGAEALIRWKSFDGSLIRPDLFIPIAEEVGLVSAITDEVIALLFNDMEDFLIQHRSLHISINVAAEDILNGHVLEVLEQHFAKSQINRNQIWIELTERAFINADMAKKILEEAKALGYILLIDDFGTGYSSLSYLQKLPIDILKIDKSFINAVGMESVTSQVTEHIINMARALNLQLIAEGVETQLQLDYLRIRQVDYIQGYLYSKSLSKEDFIEFCAINTSDNC